MLRHPQAEPHRDRPAPEAHHRRTFHGHGATVAEAPAGGCRRRDARIAQRLGERERAALQAGHGVEGREPAGQAVASSFLPLV